MNRPPTWNEVEQALLGRARRWADAQPDFYTKAPGAQAYLAVEFFVPFMPTCEEAEIDDLGAAINWTIEHVIRHLLSREPLSKPCTVCAPLPKGVAVGPDGVGTIRVWDATGVISPYHSSIQWRMAQCATTRAALGKLKQFILRGDQRQAERTPQRAEL